MRKYLFLLLFLLASCAGPSSEKMDKNFERAVTQSDHFHDQKRLVEIHDQPFVGADKAIPLNKKAARPAFLKNNITLIEQSQNLAQIAQRLSGMLGCLVNVAPIPGGKGGSGGGGGKGGSDTAFADPTGINSSLTMRLNYTGTVEGLLNTIAGRFGLQWEYLPEKNTIEFFKVRTKSFALLLSPGETNVTAEITNESSISGSTTSGDTSSDSSIEGKQELKHKSTLNPWATTLAAVQAMLSPFGTAMNNESAGTITVTDMPAILDKVEEYIKEVNRKMGRQAAITLTVYSVSLNSESSANLDISASLKNFGFDIVTTAGSGVASMGGASSILGTVVKDATIVPKATGGNMRNVMDGSTALFSVLSTWGKTSVMQRQNILTMHQKTVPVQVVRSQGYVASSSTTTTANAGNTASLEPGTVTTGFSLQVTPNILSNNSLILNYVLNLSSLEEITTYRLGSEDNTTSMIQTPTVASRSFTQEIAMKQGSMLVLSGFEMETENIKKGAGILSYGRAAEKERQLIVISIQVDSVKGAGEVMDL